MAEDDDDETFGDFAFASFQSNSQSHGLNSFADDNEWGDFLKSPQPSKLSDSSFQGNNLSDTSVSSSRWMKRSGALPLSVFGVAEEEANGCFSVLGDFDKRKSDVIDEDFGSTSANNRILNSQNLNIADLYNQYSQMKPEKRPCSNPDRVDSVENGAVNEVRKMDLSYAVDMRDQSQLGNKSDNDEFSFKSPVPDSRDNGDPFGSWSPEFTGLSSTLTSNSPIVQTTSSGVDLNGPKQELVFSAADDEDDDRWEFQDAFSENRSEEVNKNVDLKEFAERSAYTLGTGNGTNESVDFLGTSNGSIDFFAMSPETVGHFATSGGISNTSLEVDFIGDQPKMTSINGFTLHANSTTKQNNIKSLLNDSTDVLIEEFDEDFGEFTAAFSETVSNPAEASREYVLSPSVDETSTADGKILEKDKNSNFQKGAIPLSIFGNEEPESGDTSDVLDVFMHQTTSDQRNLYTPTTVTSINDLISSLYSQAEQTSSSDTVKQPTQTQFSLSNGVSSSIVVTDDDDHLDDSSWDFVNASQTRIDGEASLKIGDSHLSCSSRLKPNNYLDFYSNLKEELCFVAKCHVERLKQAQVNASLSGEVARADYLDRERQLVCEELEQMSFVGEESKFQDRLSGDTYLNVFVDVLLEPQFKKLESECHLSQKLLLVEKDLGSLVELMRHTTTMLKILTIGTSDNQRTYVTTWSKIISVCAQELKHGALIWNKAVDEHIQSQLLTESQGKEFVLALGEIYRVVVVLEASAKLFKPWTLSASSVSAAIYTLLEECHGVWSTSGLEEALSSVAAPTASDGTSIFKSIKHILDLDALTLQKCVFKENESRCCMSILTAGVVPGMKMIMWENDQCFVTLANLWANLINRNPPKLPQLNLG